jgi:anti-sigma factor RsiW
MSDPLLDILKKHDELGDEELLNYLMGHLTPDERRQVEERIAASDMNSDAEEGLSSIKSKENIAAITASLNQQLAAQLRKKRKQKKRVIPNQTLLLLATFLVLLLVVLAFVVIYKMKQS